MSYGDARTTATAKKTSENNHNIPIEHALKASVDADSLRLRFCAFALQKIITLLPSRDADTNNTGPSVECVAQRFRDDKHYIDIFVPLIEEEVYAELKECIGNNRAMIRHQGVQSDPRRTYRQANSTKGDRATAVFEVLQPCPEKSLPDSLVSVRVKGTCPFEKDDLVLITHVNITERNVILLIY